VEKEKKKKKTNNCLLCQHAKSHYEVINKVPPPSPLPTQTTSASTSTAHHSPPTPTGTYQTLTPICPPTAQIIC